MSIKRSPVHNGRKWCPPAAATSSARFPVSCPLMSLRSGRPSVSMATDGLGRVSTCVGDVPVDVEIRSEVGVALLEP